MSKIIKKMKIMQPGGTLSDYVSIGADAANIKMINNENVQNIIGDIDLKNDGSISQQLERCKKHIELGAFLTILNSSSTGAIKSDENIKKNISDLIDAKVSKYNLICEIMPDSTDKTGYEGGTLSIDDITFECYPNIEILNTYIDYAKNQGTNLSILKFHSLWAKEHLSSTDYIKFITKYKNVVMSVINSLNNKPEYVGLLNEYYSIFTNDTKTQIISLINDIKETNVKVGLCGITSQIIEYNLGNEVDILLPHFYPYATMKGEDATIQDVYEGIERSKSGEKIIIKLQKQYPEKEIIISEVGASSYWEALAQPEKWWGGTSGVTLDTNGLPMALYARGAFQYYSQFNIKGIYIFWTDTIPKYLREFFLKYFERGEL